MNKHIERDYDAARAHARTSDPETSHQAAAAVSPKLREKQQAVFEALTERGRIADAWLVLFYRAHAAARSWPEQSPSGIRTRRSELVEHGLVRDTGQRITLKGHGNRKHILWEVVPK